MHASMRTIDLVVLTFLILPFVSTAAPQGSAAELLVLQGATVIDGGLGPPIPDATLIIDGETIDSIGSRTATHPAGATIVNLEGKYIIPGLIDSHTHYEEWMGELFLNHGVTTILAVGGNLGRAKETSRRNNTRAPRIYDTAGDPRLTSDMTEPEVRSAVRKWLEAGPDFARLRSFEELSRRLGISVADSKRIYRWAADEVHHAGLMIFGHTEDAPESTRLGQDIVEHIWGFILPLMSSEEREAFRRGHFLHWSLFFGDWGRLDTAIREAVDRGVYLNPTFFFELGSLSRLAPQHEATALRLYTDPALMTYAPRDTAASLVQRQRQIRNFSARHENLVLLSTVSTEERQRLQQGYKDAGEFVRRYISAGGKVQAGTDTISGGTPGLVLHHEMQLFVEAGLTPAQALQSATSWSAETLSGRAGALGKAPVGSLRPGAFADLVVLSADPLEDIANSEKIERVMKGGRFIDLGYTADYFTFTSTPRKIAMATPEPEISAVTPHTVVEGGPSFDMAVEGVGFVSHSVVRVGGISMPTTFVDPRTLRVTIPSSVIRRAEPNRFDAPGPQQHVGVFGDRTVPITVFNPPPDGGVSNSVSLRIQAGWRAPQNP